MKRLVDFCIGLLSARIEAVDINRVTFDQNKVIKSRRWYGWILILIGNPVLACRRAPVRVLANHQWMRWERAVNQAVRGEAIRAGRVLVCDQLPGTPVAQWLIESNQTMATRLELLKVALSGLQEFHRVQIQGRGARKILLSHGDATLNNVLYDSGNHLVHWIDFDLRHWLGVPAPRRHADDLRAFLFSAVRYLSEAEIPEFLSSMQRQYDHPEVWNCLKEQLASRWFRFDVFHRAQVRRCRNSRNDQRNLQAKLDRLASLIIQRTGGV